MQSPILLNSCLAALELSNLYIVFTVEILSFEISNSDKQYSNCNSSNI